jgi:hypothetical protein
MGIEFTVEHDVEMESFVLKCADELIILRAETLEEAINEAQEIVEEWA